MNLLQRIKSRLPKLLPALAAAAVLGTAGGYATHAYATEDCCHPGSPCCHPGAACCAKHHRA
jgi:hypothetical protein